MHSIASIIKSWFIRPGKKPRLIKLGPFKGIRLNLDLAYQTQILLGLSERELFPCLRWIGDRPRAGVDIGALDCEYTLYFLSRPNMQHVIACDPSERFPALLATNLELNGRTGDARVVGVQKFVGDRDDADHCTLDTLAANLEGPCVVKIDVEGGETAILRGAHRMLARQDVFWIIETHGADLEAECERILDSRKMRTRIVKNAWWRLLVPEPRSLPHNRWLLAWSPDLEHLAGPV